LQDAGIASRREAERMLAHFLEHPDPNGYLQMSARFMDEM